MKIRQKIKHSTYLLLLVCLGFSLHAQSSKDDKLTALYNQIYTHRHDYEVKAQLLTTFKATLLNTLKSKPISNLNLESFNKHVKQITSPDGKLTIISWDEFSGGTWHVYNAAYQYTHDSGLLEAQIIGKDLEVQDALMFADAYYLKIHHIEATKYLIKGYGSHGYGHDFYTFRLFDFSLNKPSKDCKNGFDGKRIFCFEKPRHLNLKPKYIPKEQHITYPELVPNILDGEDTGFSKPNGKYQTLIYNNGTFTTL